MIVLDVALVPVFVPAGAAVQHLFIGVCVKYSLSTGDGISKSLERQMGNVKLKFDTAKELTALSVEQLAQMADAGDMLKENLHLLKKSGHNPVGRCLENQGVFYEDSHYPEGDVYDKESHAQYYYHAHRPDSGEHGHFHTFVRARGMPKSMKPVPYKGDGVRPAGKDAISHIVAISMDRPGMPIGMFTTNRWVTGESMYSAEDAYRLIDRFVMEQSYPCLATNRVLTALLGLFKPQIKALLELRDKTIANWTAEHPDRDVYEDRDLELTSIIDINIDRQIAAVRRAHREALKR